MFLRRIIIVSARHRHRHFTSACNVGNPHHFCMCLHITKIIRISPARVLTCQSPGVNIPESIARENGEGSSEENVMAYPQSMFHIHVKWHRRNAAIHHRSNHPSITKPRLVIFRQ